MPVHEGTVAEVAPSLPRWRVILAYGTTSPALVRQHGNQQSNGAAKSAPESGMQSELKAIQKIPGDFPGNTKVAKRGTLDEYEKMEATPISKL